GRPFDPSRLPTRRALAGEAEPEATVRFRTRGSDHDRWSMVRARLLTGSEPEADLVITSFQDITGIKQVERRLSFLLRASALLGETADYHDTLSRIAWLVVPSIADWCVFDVLAVGDSVERVATAHADPEMLRLADDIGRRWPPDLTQPGAVREVLRTRHAVHVREVSEAALAAGARDEQHLAALQRLGMREALSVPLMGRGHVLGAVTVAQSSQRPPLSPEDVAMIEDLGRRAGAAVDAALLLEESQESLRLQEEFMAVTSHDMRTPLAAVRGYAQLARRHLSGEQQDLESVDRWLGDIDESAARLTSLVSEFMDVTLLRAGQEVPLQLEPTDVAEIARERVREHQGAAGELHRFSISTQPDAVVGNWDAVRIGRVLDNLLGNAVKFSPDGGRIDVSISATDEHVTIEISDQGIGIAPQDLARIFLPMYRGANARGVAGTGLGLAGSRRLVDLMGGQVTVKSRLGKGSTFTVALPLAGPELDSTGG
ncbi:MAG TPA: GAF domain-containing sensor histidine kinase, partial [Candidatus Limnocylindria bacterium]|nr:GAF domain-containing sensor histidine kinase [Candidatus Limnocylindria bacterium]